MSISLSIGSFKNAADRNRQQQQYHEYLRLQSKLNEKAEKANNQLARNQVLGIRPGPPPFTSTEEELQDIVAMREIALKNLKEIMPREALAGLQYLPDIDELQLFNKHFGDFKAKIAGQRLITPEYFSQLWERYKSLLASTDDTGISIALTQTDLEESLRRQSNVIRNQLTRMTTLSNADRQRVIDVLKKAVSDGNAVVVDKIETAVNDGNIEILTRISSEGLKTRIGIEDTKIRVMTVAELKHYIREILGLEAFAPDSVIKKHTGLTSLVKDNLREYVLDYLHREEPPFSPARSARSAGSDPPLSPARTASEADVRDLMKDITPKKKGRGIVGYGFSFGGGLVASSAERYIPFGRYMLHLPSLKQNKLNMKYPSLTRIVEFPSTPISTHLKNFIKDLLENKRMNIKAYHELKDSDRKLFNRAARKARLDDMLGIDDDDEEIQERERTLDRYEVLKVEIAAGNDAPQLRQELKRILSRFIADGTVSRSAGTQALIELSL